MRRRIAGFSLIEVVITVAIIGLLASIAAPLAETAIRRSKEHDLKQALMTMRNAIDAYKDASDAGMIAKAVGQSGYPRGLAELVEGVENKKSPDAAKIYFLRRIPRDPFATNDALPAEATWGLRSYDSPPDDPRVGADVFDIYSKADGTGLNGVPYRQW